MPRLLQPCLGFTQITFGGYESKSIWNILRDLQCSFFTDKIQSSLGKVSKVESYVKKNADRCSGRERKRSCSDLQLAVLRRVELQIPCPQLARKPSLIKLAAGPSGRKERELC